MTKLVPLTLKIHTDSRSVQCDLSGSAAGEPLHAGQAVDWDEVGRTTHAVLHLLEQSRWRDGGRADDARRLNELGAQLTRQLIPEPVRRTLSVCPPEPLLLVVDDRAQGVPWELLGWDEACLGTRFAIGRIGHQPESPADALRDHPPLSPSHITLVANPRFDLPAASSELEFIRRLSNRREDMKPPQALDHHVSRQAMLDALDEADWLHYAGHHEDSDQTPQEDVTRQGRSRGWQLADGPLGCDELKQTCAKTPTIVVNNACATDQGTDPHSGQWTIRMDLANLFASRGTVAYIGTIAPILDRSASQLMRRVYELLFAGRSMGEALRSARSQESPTGTIGWASHFLFGDPGLTPFPVPEEELDPFPTECFRCRNEILTPHGAGRWVATETGHRPICRPCVRTEPTESKPPVKWALDRHSGHGKT